jgi:isocitrate/isopropylmalate dehydrogenase
MTRITVAKGDGIGPEIMDATLDIIKAAGAQLEYDEIEVGEKVYLSGNSSGILGYYPKKQNISKSTNYNTTRWRI